MISCSTGFLLPALLYHVLLVAPLAALHAVEPTSLKTEFLDNPLAIDTAEPRFSWIVEDTTAGAKQTAYQVQAASSPSGTRPNWRASASAVWLPKVFLSAW